MTSNRETMTSRERVLAAIEHREPDRVPIDLGGNQTGIHRLAYEALLETLGLAEETVIVDAVQQLAQPSEAVLQRLRVDTRYVRAKAGEGFVGRIVTEVRDGKTWHDLTDEFGVRWSMPDDAPLYMDITHHPLADATIDDIDRYPFPFGNDPARFEGLREEALRIRNETPCALVTGISGVVYETCWYLRGLERWFMDMLEQPRFCEELLERVLVFWLQWFDGFLNQVGDLVDVIMIGDDLAGQSGPLFSPRIYRDIVQPRQRRLVQAIKCRTRAKIWYHTCGACKGYIPDLLDNGIDILNPVQISAAGMDPTELKREFGDRLVFWGGGIDTQRVLPVADAATIREHVRRNMEAFKPGGGYVFNSVHNIQSGVSGENTLALFDAAHEFGFYGGGSVPAPHFEADSQRRRGASAAKSR